MVDRQKLEAILTRRFPGSTPSQIAAAANAIMGLKDEWEEVDRSSVARSSTIARGIRLAKRRPSKQEA